MKKSFLILVILLSVKFVVAQTAVKCGSCNGVGHHGVCHICGGSGGYPTMYGFYPCSACLTKGVNVCWYCAGKGFIIVDVPPTPNIIGNTYNNSGINSSSSSKKYKSVCRTCQGGGKCIGCHGTGFRTDNAFGTGVDYSKKCGVCRGRGICTPCKGTGYL